MSFSKPKRLEDGSPTDPHETKEVPESVSMVMNLEELREMIVTCVVASEHFPKDTREKDIRSLRLVSKGWLCSVSKVVYKNALPMVQFNFNKQNDACGGSENSKQKFDILDKFVKEFGSAFTANDKNAPTYSLDTGCIPFESESFHILQNCLVSCGRGVVQFEINLFQRNHMPTKLPNFAFPNLNKLKLNVERMYTVDPTTLYYEADAEKKRKEIGILARTGNLLKHLLEAGSSLKELTLQNSNGLHDFGFENVLLPSALSKLSINAFSLNDLQILSGYALPKLSYLNLTIREVPVLDESFFNMLNNWRKSLKKLYLAFDTEVPISKLRFPVMEKLEALTFEFKHDFELQRNDNSFEICFPSLKNLKLSLTERGFQMWCMNSVYRSVDDLRIKLNDGQQRKEIPMNFQKIQVTGMTFPNVTTLHITILGSDVSVPQYIFRELGRLKKLDLFVDGTGTITNTNLWDALLIGTTVETVKTLKDKLNKQDNAAILENANIPSIRCLANLETLALNADKGCGCGVEDEGRLISEISFIHAFFKMPKLKVLKVVGRFEISKEMWKSLEPKMGHHFVIC